MPPNAISLSGASQCCPPTTRGGRHAASSTDEKVGPRTRIIVKGGEGAATRVVGFLSGIFSFAVSEGIRSDNPVRGVRRYADGKSERTLRPDELAALGKALRTIESRGGNPSAIAIILLLIFTVPPERGIFAL